MRRLLACLTLACAFTLAQAAPTPKPAPLVKVRLKTFDGDIVLELDRAKAPITVENFLQYVRDKHYDGTIFHRVIPGFVIQGGGFTAKFDEKPTRAPIKNESGNGLSNGRGTVAMARTADPDSATAQFYVNLGDNGPARGAKNLDTYGGGYTVFGRVIEGMEVVDKIAAKPTGPGGPFPTDVPQTTALVIKAELVAEPKAAKPKQ